MEIKITKKEYAKIISNELAFEIHEFYHKIKDIPNEEIIGLELDEIDEGFAEKLDINILTSPSNPTDDKFTVFPTRFVIVRLF